MTAPDPKVLILAETGPPLRTDLTPGQVAALLALRHTVKVTPAPGRLWDVRGNQRVGVLRSGTGADRLEIRIQPKMPIERLLFLIGDASATQFWREETVTADRDAHLETVVADLFARTLAQALDQGVLHGYRYVEDDSSVVRGRIRTSAMLRRGGFPLPIPVAYDDFTANTDENRILRTAADRCLALSKLSEQTRTRLRHQTDKLIAAVVLPRGTPPPLWTPTRLNERYHPALRLAELILRASSPDPGRGGGTTMNGFVVDLEDVFERFLTRHLLQTLARRGLRSAAQREHRLDEAQRITIRPDMTVYRNGRVAAVVDAKYAALSAGRPGNEHTYQLVAYCTALGLTHGHLVYAAGEPALTTHTIRTAGSAITAHALDLDQPPERVAAQIDAIGDWIVDTVA